MANLPYIDPNGLPAQLFNDALALKEDKDKKGAANGYAPLDGSARVPTAFLPDLAALDAEVDQKIETHNNDTTAVHGIANTANLVLTNDARLTDARTPTSHTHPISQINSLQAALDSLQSQAVAYAIAL